MKAKAALKLTSTAFALFLVSALFAGEDTITLTNSQVFTGVIRGKEAGFIAIEIKDGSGTAIRRFIPQEIKELHFGDTALLEQFANEADTSLRHKVAWLEPIALRRAPFLGSLSETDERVLVTLIDLLIESGHPTNALEYAKLWYPNIGHESNKGKIEIALILAALNAGEIAEAEIHAKTIALSTNDEAAALAWHALALAHLQRGESEDALWKSLVPISNFQGPPSPYLAKCYQSAIAACIDLQRFQHGQTLHQEMLNLNLDPNTEIQIPDTTQEILETPASILAPHTPYTTLFKSKIQ